MQRTFHPFSGERWTGDGIAYGPHRDGQRPGGPGPTREQLREDLHLIARRWGLLRLYGSAESAGTILEIIRTDRLALDVMLGVWIEPEELRDERGAVVDSLPAKRAANRNEIDSGVRLAAAYPDIVRALCVGNEALVSWSAHRCPPELLVRYLREARSRTEQPVTTADDYGFWIRPESAEIAREVDFIVTHLHPMWNGIQLDDAVAWVDTTLAKVRAAHPDRMVIVGETGWATRKHTEGDQGRLIKGTPGEAQQKIFHDAVSVWADRVRVPLIFFEAFDENWKGGPHPDEVEKHWGLYRADRTPKEAVADVR